MSITTTTCPDCDQPDITVTGEMIAAKLAGVAARLRGPANYGRDSLKEASNAFSAGDMEAARTAIAEGLSHAFGSHSMKDCPESWLLLAIRIVLDGHAVDDEFTDEDLRPSVWSSIVGWLKDVRGGAGTKH